MIPAILIVGYCRPQNIELLLLGLLKSENDLFVFIDNSDSDELGLNFRVKEIVHRFSLQRKIHILQSSNNIGPQSAVAKAVDWVLQSRDSVIVLEDDSTINQFTIAYFNENVCRLGNQIALVSGRSITNELFRHDLNSAVSDCLVNSSYPLSNGWMTNSENWAIISRVESNYSIIRDAIIFSVKMPRYAKSLMFFGAGSIRFRNKIGKVGWDSILAFNMLIQGISCIIPNINMVGNIGIDRVASNTKSIDNSQDGVLIQIDQKEASRHLCAEGKIYDRFIEHYIYKLRAKHFFSLIKAIFDLFKFKLQKKINSFQQII